MRVLRSRRSGCRKRCFFGVGACRRWCLGLGFCRPKIKIKNPKKKMQARDGELCTEREINTLGFLEFGRGEGKTGGRLEEAELRRVSTISSLFLVLLLLRSEGRETERAFVCFVCFYVGIKGCVKDSYPPVKDFNFLSSS